MKKDVARFTIDIPRDLHYELRLLSLKHNISMRELLVTCMKSLVKNMKQDDAVA